MAFLIYFGAALFFAGGLAMTTAFIGDPTSTFWMRIVLGFLAVLLGLTLFIVGAVLHGRRSDAWRRLSGRHLGGVRAGP